MAPGIDNSGFPGLLCVEDNVSVFFDETDSVSSGAMWRRRSSHQDDGLASVGGEDGLSLLPPQSEEYLSQLLQREHQHMPNCNYVNRLRNGDLDSCSRKEAIDWIIKVHSHFKFGPLCAYLSISYLDRFLSSHNLPDIGWMIQLLAVSCLSLAAKVEEIDVPLSLDLQVCESKYIFEARTIQRMELLVLSKLCWRMQAVTPFSFLDHFLTKIKINGGDVIPLPTIAIQRSIQIILSTIGAIDLLEFRPSEIAAAVAISVVKDTEAVDALLSLSQHVKKERIEECMKVIHGLVSTSVPQSPIGVLDITCFSYKSDEAAFGSCADSSQNKNSGSKRRKIDRQTDIMKHT